MNFVDNCRKFIAIDSSQIAGTAAISQFAKVLCVEAGLSAELQDANHDGLPQANVIASTGSLAEEAGILLLTHLDTADPGLYASWTKTAENPFNASIYSDEIFGLGVASKLDFVCKLEALKQVNKINLKKPVRLIGTYGEESGMTGTLRLVRHKKIKSARALIGEPTELQLVNASLGVAAVEIVLPFSQGEVAYRRNHDDLELTSSQSKLFYGKGAHSAHPRLGENAIINMLKYLSQLPDGVAILEMDGGVNFNIVPESAHLEIDVVGELKESITSKIRKIMRALEDVENDFHNYPAPGFEPAIPTMNLGTIRTLEDHIIMRGACRIPPTVGETIYYSWIDGLRYKCAEVGATFRVTEYKSPFQATDNGAFFKLCQEAQGGGEPARISTCTEASVLMHVGVECLVFGPGRGVGNTHSPNESIKISDLNRAVEFYRKIIERICL